MLGKLIGETWSSHQQTARQKAGGGRWHRDEDKESAKAIHHTVSLCHLIWVFAENVDLRRVFIDDSLGRICG